MSEPVTRSAGVPSPTGHPLVDEVVSSLERLADLPVADHLAVYEAAHDRLREALAGTRDAPGPAVDPR